MTRAESEEEGIVVYCTDKGVQEDWIVRPNVRAKRATTAGRQARPQENVHRTLRPGLVACRWRSA